MPHAVHGTNQQAPLQTTMDTQSDPLPASGSKEPDFTMLCDGDEDSSQFSMSPREQHDQESEMCLKIFENWSQSRQLEFVEQLVSRMSFNQHEHIYSILMPMLQRDFITALPSQSV